MAVFCSKQIVVPVTGKMLGDYAEGDIVYLNESGSPVEFYVAKHDYESGLNGSGRTLLVRKECHSNQSFDRTGASAATFPSSTIDIWLNGDYKSLLDANIKDIIGTTVFYYISGTIRQTLSRSVFLLSITELGRTDMSLASDGTRLPIASALQIAYLNGATSPQWTRTPDSGTGSTTSVWILNTAGNLTSSTTVGKTGSRPVFTLPGTALFDPNTNKFKGVA